MDYMGIQALIKNLDVNQMADLLAQRHPEIDSTKLLMAGGPGPTELPPSQQSPMGFNSPEVYGQAAPAGNPAGFLAALSGVQSGMQPPRAQMPSPAHFAFGSAQLAKPQVNLPGPPTLSQLILGGR